MTTEIIKVPDIGDIEKAAIIEIPVSVGDTIAEEDTLIVIESDKASMDVPSPKAGKITAIKLKVGDQVSEGDEILYLEIEGAAATPSAPVAAPAAAAPSTATSSVQQVTIPDIGASDVRVIEVNIKVGDIIAEDDAIATLESDKASMEVPASVGGEVVAIHLNVGDTVNEGDLSYEVKVAGAAPAQAAPTAPTASAAPTSAVESIYVPDIGSSDVNVIEINVKVGDIIAEDDPIATLESDKASMEVPSPKGGEVVAIKFAVGDTVNEGDLMIELKVAGSGSAAPAPVQAAAPAKAAPSAPVAAAQPKAQASTYATDSAELTKPSKNVHAGPAVRMLAREFGVDLAFVAPTGPRNRILKEDVANWVKQKLREPKQVAGGAGIPTIPDQDYAKFGEVTVEKMPRIQQLTAQNMVRNWLNIPHVTVFEEADVTDLEAFRTQMRPEAEKRGSKLSALAFVIKAAAAGLREFPQFNVSLLENGTEFVQKHYVNIGFAVDTPNGLVVPVIRDADKKSVWAIADEIIELATKGRKGQLKPADMQGGCFTISSLGGLGSTSFTPIVNAPEVAILGLSNNQIKPQWNGKEFEPRSMLPLSLSFDHRAINGADGARFTTFLKNALTDLRRLVM